MNRRDFVKTVSAVTAFEVSRSKSNAQNPGVSAPSTGARFDVPRGQRQLFIDDHGIAKTENLVRTMHQPLKKGAVIRPDPSRGITSLQIRSAPNWDPDAKHFKFWIMSQPDDLEGVGAAGLKYVRQHHDWNRIAGQLVDIYQQAGGARKMHPSQP